MTVMSNGAAIAYNIGLDHQGQSLSVTFGWKTVEWAKCDALQTTPIDGLSGVVHCRDTHREQLPRRHRRYRQIKVC